MRRLRHYTALSGLPCGRLWCALRLVLLCGAVLLLPRPGWSASQQPLSLEEMVGLAQEIVVGRVVRSEARWQGKLIVTVSTIEIEEPLKGQPGAQVEITQPGGTAMHPVLGAPVTMTVSSHVALRPGEHVLLFVRQTTTGIRQLVGAQQGKFVIREEATSRARNLPIGPKQLMVVRQADQHTVTAEAMPLEAMLDRIRTYIEQPGKQPGGKER